MSNTPTEGREAPIHDYFPEFFQKHLDNNWIFQVTQALEYRARWNAIDLRDGNQTSWLHHPLQAGEEIHLTGSCTRLKIEGDSSNLRKIIYIEAQLIGGEIVDVKVADIKDLTEYLTPLDFPNASDVVNKIL